MTPTRRDVLRLFLQGAGCFTAMATTSFAPLVRPAAAAPGAVGFGQGVASADPQPDAVLLWTRAAPDGDEDRVELVVQVSTRPSFETVLLEREI